jgi:alkyl-hydroperoxide reductase/thiol specific antioxidant family protein
LRETDREFAQNGIAVRFVTIGSQEKAVDFCARHNPDAACIGDVDMHTYKAMGFTDFDLTKLKTTPELVARRDENEAAGFRQDWDATRIEDAAQNPGAAVIDRDGTLRWVHSGWHPGDLPPMREMLETAKTALER